MVRTILLSSRSTLGLVALACALLACGDSDSAASGSDTTTGSDTAGTDTASSDSGGTDASDTFIPPLEKISLISFELNGVSNAFDLNGNADYITNEKQLKIAAAKGLRKIEINVLPVDPFAVGQWEDTVVTEVGIAICFDDGVRSAGPIQDGPCATRSHQAIEYNVTISDNNGVGSFVTGTFTATLADAFNDTVALTAGTFDVKHK